MSMDDDIKANASRFSGFTDEYDSFRPQPPLIVTRLVLRYLERQDTLSVADMGCGTGLSTYLWDGIADTIFGIEPNPDMLKAARAKLARTKMKSTIHFIAALAQRTGLQPESVNIVTCSQSFHWMEPVSTLAEFNRILRPGGIFATYDYDWPPSIDTRAEQAYAAFSEKVEEAYQALPDDIPKARRWNKTLHLHSISDANYFPFTREILFHNVERCTARRFVGLALSRGSLQTLLKVERTEESLGLDRFKKDIASYFGAEEKEMLVSYRLRMGRKEG